MSLATDRTIRTYKPRRGRMGARHDDALDRLWPLYGIDTPIQPGPPTRFFPRNAPVVVEIGSGMGEGTAAMAAADPARDYIAVEVHTPGVANLLALVEERSLGNVRVVHGDALELLRALSPDSLDAVHAFFPDPWPKMRHHKRRLLRPEHVALLRSRLALGGTLHCATDWTAYAEAALEVLSADPGLVNGHQSYAPRPATRPVTKFEQRGIDAGRQVHDLVFTRR